LGALLQRRQLGRVPVWAALIQRWDESPFGNATTALRRVAVWEASVQATALRRVPVWEAPLQHSDECLFGKRHCSTQTSARLESATASLGRVPVWKRHSTGTSVRLERQYSTRRVPVWEAPPQRRDKSTFGKRHSRLGTSARLGSTTAALRQVPVWEASVPVWEAPRHRWDGCPFGKLFRARVPV